MAGSAPGMAGTRAPPRSRAAAKGSAVELPAPAVQGPGKGAQGAQEIEAQLQESGEAVVVGCRERKCGYPPAMVSAALEGDCVGEN